MPIDIADGATQSHRIDSNNERVNVTPRCPSCKSDNLRRSRHRPDDGLWRSIFYSAYRCRACGRRFQRLTQGLMLGVAIAAAVVLTFGIGFTVAGLVLTAPTQAEPATGSAAPPEMRNDVGDSASAPVVGDLALAALAEGGDPRAQLQLGIAYLKGQGVERDPAIAMRWIERSAEQQLAEAQYTLGAMHHAGRGALQSFPLAFKWFELAAQQNHAEAQYSLGIMYRNGQGVAVDKSKAYIWFNLASAQGHERARDARNSLLPALTPEQVLAAQRAAQDWRPTGPRIEAKRSAGGS